MGQKEVAELLQRYLNGEATPHEADLVSKWYGSIQTGKKLLDADKLIISKKMRRGIKNAIKDKAGKKLIHHPVFKLAALVFIIGSIGLFFLQNKSTSLNSETLNVSTQVNQRKEITLSDGSKVTLEPSSTIIYPQTFSLKSRKVQLVAGEAFFSVSHEQKRSFIVQSQSGFEVSVLGTSFTVHNLKKENFLKVTVSTGKVAVRNQGTLVATLIRGQELQFNKSSFHSTVRSVLKPPVVKISFDGSSLLQVIQKMNYVYSIDIQLHDTRLFRLKTTAEFNSAQQPAEIIDILCRLHHLRFSASKDHKTYKIYQ
jgi:transmembrane sensor